MTPPRRNELNSTPAAIETGTAPLARPAEPLVPRVAGDRLGRPVEAGDEALRVDREDAVRDAGEDDLEPLLRQEADLRRKSGSTLRVS